MRTIKITEHVHAVGLDEHVQIPLKENLNRIVRDLLLKMEQAIVDFNNERSSSTDGTRLLELVAMLAAALEQLHDISAQNVVAYVNGAIFNVAGMNPEQVFEKYDQLIKEKEGS